LHVSLSSFTNCLYLLDEHFNQLRTFYINISTITSRLKVNNKGLFGCVREISLFDERSFEYEFFLRIAQSFPLIGELTLINEKLQKHKQCRKSKDDEQDISIVKYPHLTYLNLYGIHEDYIE
ncbi:unnamed protein product, partial [Rotaria sp. Silwood2]